MLASALTETCAFSCAFIQRFEVMPGFSVICYTMPMPMPMPMPEDKAGPRLSWGRVGLGLVGLLGRFRVVAPTGFEPVLPA